MHGQLPRNSDENLVDIEQSYRWLDSLQKTAVLGTSHIIRKVLQCETLSLSGGGSPLVQEKYQEEKTCDKKR